MRQRLSKTKKKIAQVSTEYIVIVAIILGIALVVVLLFGRSLLMSSTEKEKIGKVAWASAFPLAVEDISWNYSSIYFYVKNNDMEPITIRFMRFSPYAAAQMNLTVHSYERRRISFGLWPYCPGSGLQYEFTQFYFIYDKGLLTNFSEKVDVPYVGRCL